MNSAEDLFELRKRLFEYEIRRAPFLSRLINGCAPYVRRFGQYIRHQKDLILADESARLFNDRCDAAISQLTRESPFIPFTSDIPTVICVMRNEEYRIRAFIEHYLKLGIRSIHIIDNQSEDMTARIALEWPWVTVWRATGSFLEAEHGYLWSGALCRTFGIGKWILSLDADEFLAYPNMEQKGLGDLQAWLTARGKSSLAMPVVDMYPRGLVENESCGNAGLQDFIDQTPYFDRPITKPSSTCWIQNSNRGFELKGGVRLRMMHDICVNQSPWVNVIPLVKWTEHTAYHTGSRHAVFPINSNNEMFFAAILHFKFLRGFESKLASAIKENQHWNNSIEYRRYAEWIAAGKRDLFDEEYSVQFQGCESLLQAGLIQPIKWSA